MSLTEQEIESKLAEFVPWLHRLAKQFPVLNEDDLVQEALLAIWKELTKYKGVHTLDSVIKNRAKWTMLDLVQGKSTWTAHKSPSKYQRKYTDTATSDFFDLAAPDDIENAEFRAYRKEITDTMSNFLTDKQKTYMVMEHVHCFRRKDIVGMLGYYPYNIISETTKQKMRDSLNHLESMVKSG